MEELGLVIKREDHAEGVIRAQGGSYMTGGFLCSGNLIGVFLKRQGPGTTQVEVQEKYVLATQVLGCQDKAPLFVSRMSRKLREGASSAAHPAAKGSSSVVIDYQLGNHIADLVKQLTTGITHHHVLRLAVLPVADSQHTIGKPLGNYLTGKLTNDLHATGQAKVIERSRLDKVFDELALTMSGRFDDASVKPIGRLLGVDAVIVAAYAELGAHTVEVNARIVNVETAEVLGVGTIQIPKAVVQLLLQ